ncbi:winged helix-turn-helix transcriptional regulator [Amycolatopsis nigrescens]|uniref:winged helix-turn-helix transcriptional regulator n=1 Tax=Amycolatopsis nigrescens TaxID=381445 RepID=UPI000363869F|nr:helix-turn-helix domain-containing protein [Amycolatopsis nigrescens]
MDTTKSDGLSLTELYVRDCPARTVLAVLANKWAVLVMGSLREGPMRFNELRRLLDGITQKMLTQTLRSLERDGLVHRTVYPTVPPRVEYSRTELGVGAAELLAAIGEWSYAHIDEIFAAREDYDRKARLAPEPLPS